MSSLEETIRILVKEGKPVKQAVAIAHSKLKGKKGFSKNSVEMALQKAKKK